MGDDSPAIDMFDEADLRPRLEALLAHYENNKERTVGWFTASFVAFNAAGLATTLSFSDHIGYPKAIITLFALSLLLSFVSAVLHSVAMSRSWDITDGFLDQLKLTPARRDPEKFEAASRRFAEINSQMGPLIGAGFCAAAASLAAAALFATSFRLEDVANDRRCLAIQRDMLSARPRRTDGPDLFQALGCRPRGEGSVYAPPQRAA